MQNAEMITYYFRIALGAIMHVNTRIHGAQPTSFAEMEHVVQGMAQQISCAPYQLLIKHLIRPK